MELSNLGTESERRVVVMLQSLRVNGHTLKLTFNNVPPDETASAVVESAVLQRDASMGMFPTVQVVEPKQ